MATKSKKTEDENKIDISSVNKTKKQFKLPKFTNPFKKQSGIKRDAEGKFTSGSGGLKTAQKLNLKRSLPIVIVVALVGGFFVFRSFAATTLYANQYSVARCSEGLWAQSIEVKESCQNKSAEGLTFRMYKAVLGNKPDAGGYKYWTQKLAGDRVKASDMAKSFVAANKAAQAKSNSQFMDDLYKNLLKRNPDAAGKAGWVKKLDSKEWTKAKVVAHFVSTNEAMTKQTSDFNTYLVTAPRVSVVQTAKKIRDERLTKATQVANSAKSKYNSIKALPSGSRKYRDTAASVAAKAKPSRADLTTIANQEKAVRSNLSKAQKATATITANEKSNKGFYDRANTVAKYSPDISASAIKQKYDATVSTRKESQAAVDGLKKLVSDISSSYKAAEGKYQAEQRRIAAAEAARVAAQTPPNTGGAGSDRQLNPASCPTAPSQIRNGMGANCTAKFQAAYGLSVDGVWGNNTTAKYNQVHSGGGSQPQLTDYQIKDKMCMSLYGVHWSEVAQRCNTPTQSTSTPKKSTRGRAPWPRCGSLSNTDTNPKTCYNGYKGINTYANVDYFTDLKRCTKQFGMLRSCTWYGWNGSSFVKGY